VTLGQITARKKSTVKIILHSVIEFQCDLIALVFKEENREQISARKWQNKKNEKERLEQPQYGRQRRQSNTLSGRHIKKQIKTKIK